MRAIRKYCWQQSVFAIALLTFGVPSAEDARNNDSMKADAPKKVIDVKVRISDDDKTVATDKESKNPRCVAS
jgi:hypothetical protein